MSLPVPDRQPLTKLQQGMVFAGLRSAGTDANVLQGVVELVEPIELDEFKARVEDATRRISLLRTYIDAELDGGPMWRQAEDPSIELDSRQLGGRSDLEAFLSKDRTRGFSLNDGVLWRIAALQVGPAHFLVLTVHNALADRATVAWLLGEMIAEGNTSKEPVTDGGLGALARRMEEASGAADGEYWRERLDRFEAPTPAPFSGDEVEAGVAKQQLVSEYAIDLSGFAGFATRQNLFEAAASVLLSYYGNTDQVLFGSVTDLRQVWGGDQPTVGAPDPLGPAIAPLPVTAHLASNTGLGDVLAAHHADFQGARDHAAVAPLDLMAASGFDAGGGLFDLVLLVESPSLLEQLNRSRPGAARTAWFEETPPYPVMLYVTPDSRGVALRLTYGPGQMTESEAALVLSRYERILEAMVHRAETPLVDLPLLVEGDADWSGSLFDGASVEGSEDLSVHSTFSTVAARSPEGVALVHGDQELTYGELDRRANQVANLLISGGVGAGDLVALAVDRSIETVVGMLGILKAGAAYVPMDPGYPADRLQFMLEDSGASTVLVTGAGLPHVDLSDTQMLDISGSKLEEQSDAPPAIDPDPNGVAYVIYTSGSTGRPKGVVVEHRNVLNFFQGMDERVPGAGPEGVWLAVTSVSFDISVLELLWTLARGFKVVLFDPTAPAKSASAGLSRTSDLPLGLFYFAADEGTGSGNPYRLLLEGARFADENGFAAVWTPERHFHAFGGLYPNPSVTGAAVAAITNHVEVRAGSVVLPLHHPARVAEEWSVVDNLSGGRVGIAFASGWHPNDFILRPEGFEQRKVGLFEWADEVQRLWRGEVVQYQGPTGDMVEVATLPRPVQEHLPVWITAAGSPETVRRTGAAGHNLLTHLLGQTIEELGDRIRLYREARREAGHRGPGKVAVMLHTYVGVDDDEVKEEVRGPMVEYLRSSMGLVKNHVAAWEAFSKKASGAAGPAGDEFDRLGEEDVASLLNFSFERYYETSALLGSRERAADLMAQVLAAGADEIACLIDFGVSEDRALEALPHLREVGRQTASQPGGDHVSIPAAGSFAKLIETHGVTHFQGTPSLVRLLMADPENRSAMSSLSTILIGGEAFGRGLARDLKAATSATVLNMYGPTEATVWSSSRVVSGDEEWSTMPLGKPLANLAYFVGDRWGRLLPVGVVGELMISGDSVTRGYLNRDELTDERFPRLGGDGHRTYRTGDLVKFSREGEVLFLGRIDQQVKIRGHRIELGEIQSVLEAHPDLAEAAVTLDSPSGGGEGRLTGHFVCRQPGGVSRDALKIWMKERLPEVMVPSHWVELEALPKTPNLKVDRKALGSRPAQTGADVRPSKAPPPGGAQQTQELVLGIWREELGIDEIGLDDNFFDIGGHSLLVVQVHLRLKSAIGRDLPITDLFQHPTVRTLAASLAADDSATEAPAQKRAAMRKRMRRRAGTQR